MLPRPLCCPRETLLDGHEARRQGCHVVPGGADAPAAGVAMRHGTSVSSLTRISHHECEYGSRRCGDARRDGRAVPRASRRALGTTRGRFLA